ncbi:uncharacterized protein [Argopecten irradians]|uniref:uncharacterized protein n=1 Tax=Argopecten irradians TaxID=31199 RepID=UPI00371A6F03
MVNHCVVYRCSNRQNQEAKEKGVSFFRFPKDSRKRKAWVTAVNRANWLPNEESRICSEHFHCGWHSDEPADENYRPTLFSYKEKTPSVADQTRTDRQAKRSLLQEINETEFKKRREEESNYNFSMFSHHYCKTHQTVQPTEPKTFVDKGVQCDPDPLFEENRKLKKELKKTKEQVQESKWGVHKIQDNDEKTRFYTGLPTFTVFLWLFNFLKPKAEKMRYWVGQKTSSLTDRQRPSTGSLELVDQLFAVLMRLRLGLLVADLSDRFLISEGTFSKYFSTWIVFLRKELDFLNPFPSRDIIDRIMPTSFRLKYPSVRVIIDCTEIFIQRSSSLLNQSMTFSNYKHHTTIKFLVGITPSGIISFVSDGWPGKTSDRQLTIESGLIDLLNENDSIMADKGFTIRDVLEKKKCKLNIPPFKGASGQFSTDEVFETQEIASLRIHVERSIGRVKNFHILDGVMPLTLQPLSTHIFKVICWLTNFDVPLEN